MTLLSHGKTKTHKPHRCWGCTETFPAGTVMHRCVTKDGEILTSYWCEPCQAFIDDAIRRDPDLRHDGFEYGCVKECKDEASRWETSFR